MYVEGRNVYSSPANTLVPTVPEISVDVGISKHNGNNKKAEDGSILQIVRET